jgi:hypothetical protein
MEKVTADFMERKLARVKTSLQAKGLIADDNSFAQADPDVEWLHFMLEKICTGAVVVK